MSYHIDLVVINEASFPITKESGNDGTAWIDFPIFFKTIWEKFKFDFFFLFFLVSDISPTSFTKRFISK